MKRENIEIFHSSKRVEWLMRVMEIREKGYAEGDKVTLYIVDMEVEDLLPEHITSLACLVEYLYRQSVAVIVDRRTPCGEFLCADLHLWEYWGNRKDYFPARNDTILNLWHVKSEQTEEHARRITDYLKNATSRTKDLSAVTNSLHEAYYNIKDHSHAGENAFSMISYNKNTQVLHVAVCGFGIGVAASVRQFDPTITDDKQALKRASEANFTVGSAAHNAGMGLDNIRRVCTDAADDDVWLISNTAALRMTGSNLRATDLGFEFKGCLLAYSVSLSHFEDEEMLEDFIWD